MNTEKQKAAELCVQGDRSVFIEFDPGSKNVYVPPYFKDRKILVLQFGKNLPIPVEDLTIDEWGICGTLSFSGMRYFVDVPWGAGSRICGEAQAEETSFADTIPLERNLKARKMGWKVIHGGLSGK